MSDQAHLKSLRDIAADYEAKLAANPDFQALQAIRSAIAAIEQTTPKSVSRERKPREHRARVGPSRNDFVREIIEAARAPVSTPLLLDALKDRGIEIGGKDPATNLASGLSRATEFVSVSYKGTKGWWLADQPIPNGQSPETDINQSLTTMSFKE